MQWVPRATELPAARSGSFLERRHRGDSAFYNIVCKTPRLKASSATEARANCDRANETCKEKVGLAMHVVAKMKMYIVQACQAGGNKMHHTFPKPSFVIGIKSVYIGHQTYDDHGIHLKQ